MLDRLNIGQLIAPCIKFVMFTCIVSELDNAICYMYVKIAADWLGDWHKKHKSQNVLQTIQSEC